MCGHACQRMRGCQRTTWGTHLAGPGWHFVSACEVCWVSSAHGLALYVCLVGLSLGGRVVFEASVETDELSRICFCFQRGFVYFGVWCIHVLIIMSFSWVDSFHGEIFSLSFKSACCSSSGLRFRSQHATFTQGKQATNAARFLSYCSAVSVILGHCLCCII